MLWTYWCPWFVFQMSICLQVSTPLKAFVGLFVFNRCRAKPNNTQVASRESALIFVMCFHQIKQVSNLKICKFCWYLNWEKRNKRFVCWFFSFHNHWSLVTDIYRKVWTFIQVAPQNRCSSKALPHTFQSAVSFHGNSREWQNSAYSQMIKQW